MSGLRLQGQGSQDTPAQSPGRTIRLRAPNSVREKGPDSLPRDGSSSLHSSWASEGSGLIHPQSPDGATWRCPGCGVHWLGTKFPKPISSFFCTCN